MHPLSRTTREAPKPPVDAPQAARAIVGAVGEVIRHDAPVQLPTDRGTSLWPRQRRDEIRADLQRNETGATTGLITAHAKAQLEGVPLLVLPPNWMPPPEAKCFISFAYASLVEVEIEVHVGISREQKALPELYRRRWQPEPGDHTISGGRDKVAC